MSTIPIPAHVADAPDDAFQAEVQAIIDAETHRERATRLHWSAAQASAMQWAATGDLRQDARGYYRTGVNGGRGRAVARARVATLIRAGLLTEDLNPTADGRAALTAWNAAGATPVAVEFTELPPLHRGEEATRRYKVWHERSGQWAADSHARLEAALALVEDTDTERPRHADRPYASVYDAIHAEDDWTGYAENIGNVETITGRDLDDEHAVLTEAAEVVDTAAAGMVVVVPCGGRKVATDVPVPAGELYTGSYHRAARRAAAVLAGPRGRVLILSALHGLVAPDEPLMPYELRAGQPGTVTGETLRTQAAELGATNATVIVLGGRAYVDLARQVWPHAAAPLQGTRGIGEQLARLAAIYNPVPPAHGPGQVAARRADRDARRRARYVTTGPLHLAGGRAQTRITFPAATSKSSARLAAAAQFAVPYGVAVEEHQGELTAHGAAEQVARYISAARSEAREAGWDVPLIRGKGSRSDVDYCPEHAGGPR
ncbi:DUF6884 domain-containing protein [Sphaerisporangium aureirubrum]|uniref:DUF6884 domain-containing protein n=1 Tax=Sphaerisporangium aureirubrum TaxID=1544736 RepID=A0ABW1NEP3_9ACTN